LARTAAWRSLSIAWPAVPATVPRLRREV
jgi:hypothetical protein